MLEDKKRVCGWFEGRFEEGEDFGVGFFEEGEAGGGVFLEVVGGEVSEGEDELVEEFDHFVVGGVGEEEVAEAVDGGFDKEVLFAGVVDEEVVDWGEARNFFVFVFAFVVEDVGAFFLLEIIDFHKTGVKLNSNHGSVSL